VALQHAVVVTSPFVWYGFVDTMCLHQVEYLVLMWLLTSKMMTLNRFAGGTKIHHTRNTVVVIQV